MDRRDIEDALRRAYKYRSANDPDGALQIFGPGARLRVSGRSDFCIAVNSYSGPNLKTALGELCKTYRASKFDIASLIIEGDRAAAIISASFEFTPTGQKFSTELAHFWTFANGKATELVEFFDTAHISHLLSDA